jgi:hypothetical protein
MRRAHLAVLLLPLISGCADDARPKANGTGGTGGSAGIAGAPGSAGSVPSSGDELCGKRPGGELGGTHVLRFETLNENDPYVAVQLERAFSDFGAGESSIYELRGMHVARADGTACISDAAALEYENTHHNWFDIARARTDGLTFELRVQFVSDAERTSRFEVVGLDDAGGEVFGPVELIGTGSPYFCNGCWDHLSVSISEVMLDNQSVHADEAGDYEPWLELYNYGSEDVNLAGWSLSDDFSDRRKWTLPNVTLPRHETRVIFADAEPEQSELHAGFALSTASRQLMLTDPIGRSDGGILLEPQTKDRSLAYSWTSGAYEMGAPTPGAPPPE